jgi:cyclopropane-fatty-acyl-phospholipid synthase
MDWGHNPSMLYKFKSKATGDLIMLEPHGRQILSLIGKDPSPRGIVQVAEMPAAIQALQSAMAQQDAQDAQNQARGDDASHEDVVSLRQRAVPFIAMMQRCLGEQHDIVWGV